MYAQVVPVKRGKISLPFFDYAVPPELEGKLMIGHLVTIPLRARTEFGIIRSFSTKTKAPEKMIKQLSGLVHERPFISGEELLFLEEISELYHTSLGSIIKSALPPLQKRKLSKLPTDLPRFPKHEINPQKPIYRNYKDKDDRLEFIKGLIRSDRRQTLILVPEAEDCKKLSELFPKDEVCILTSYLSEKDYFSCWMDVWSGNKKIIIGTRAALFLSFFDLAEIVVDQEAHTSHKSWDQAPRFNARDAALYAARHLGVPITFTGFMPSVETYYFVEHKIYSLANTLFNASLRQPHIVSLRSEYRAGNYSPFSLPLQDSIMEQPTGSIFLFCNRRGSASYIMCRDCSNVITCPSCKRSMTYHESSQELRCHHCGYREQMSPVCKKCHGANLAFFGAGTEMVAKEFQKIFPEDKREIVQIEGSELSLKKIDPDKDQIIIGTQLAWPYLPWSKLSLAAFMDADTPLFIPEYLSTERVWQSVYDALFRLQHTTPLYIQTNKPEERIFTSFADPRQFYEGELETRKVFSYPPFRFLLKLFVGTPTREEGVREVAKVYSSLAQLTKNSPDITINRPIELFPPFTKGRYWQAIILKLSYRNYKQLLRKVLPLVPETWKVDPNPTNLLNP